MNETLKERIQKQELVKRFENSETLKKGKKGFVTVVFGRTIIVFLLLAVQLFVMAMGLVWLDDVWYAFSGIMTAMGVILVIYIINKPENPAYKISWIVMIVALPIFGSALYLFVESQPLAHFVNRRLQELHKRMRQHWEQNETTVQALTEDNVQVANLARYIETRGGYPVYQNSGALYFSDGEKKFEELKNQLMSAKSFIFMEYFIVCEGYMWDSILEILKIKVQEGVEVRFLYDGTNMIANLPYHYPETLKKYGIQCRIFAPIRPAMSTIQNNRDHRKVVVIDGRVAFTGGINLADEYINRKERFGYWKDVAVMVDGEAVRSFTMMFLEMWNSRELQDVEPADYRKYLDVPVVRTPKAGDGFVMPYADSPLDNECVGEEVYIDILYTAKRYVHIMTPYLILDNEMLMALEYAAKRGVDVKIIMPHIPDKDYAFALAKTYYNELLDSGVRIYEFEPGFVHAKVFVSDDEKAVVGTINLDYRSLYLHFECAVMLYKNSEIEKIEEDFLNTLKQCIAATKADFREQKLTARLEGRVLRLLAPLM